jgi:6-phosphogluconate dehydrogenase
MYFKCLLSPLKIRQALYASKIISYAQGFMLLREAAKVFNWNLVSLLKTDLKPGFLFISEYVINFKINRVLSGIW